MERFKQITSLYLLLIHDNKILLLRRINTGYADGMYGLPSGHLEENETIREGIKREAKEEIGIDLDVDDLKLVHTMHRKENDTRVDFFFEVSKYQGTPINNEPDKCDDLQWFSLDNLPSNIVAYVKKALENSQNKIIYSESGWTSTHK
jgi:ADP-ribose pyrophosphatase YjhB (NUDIX family)